MNRESVHNISVRDLDIRKCVCVCVCVCACACACVCVCTHVRTSTPVICMIFLMNWKRIGLSE